jgi:hypothetical protein
MSKKRTSPKTVVTLAVVAVFAVAAGLLVVFIQPEKVSEAAAGAQRIRIATANSAFTPNEVTAKAGTPIELEFPPGGAGCTASITFPDLNLSKDLSRGGIMALPALKAGVYPWKGACGSESGSLKVE